MELFTFDTRNNIFWNVIQDYFKMDDKKMHEEICTQFNKVCKILNNKGIEYCDLKNILVPSKDKLDICFVFDSLKTKSKGCYGYEILKSIIPEILRIEKTSVFYGDIITGNSIESQQKVKNELQKYFPNKYFGNYVLSNQYFVVYINNITEKKKNDIALSLKSNSSYVGCIDMSFSSYLKDVLSMCIGQRFFKLKNKICVPVPEDDTNNPQGYVDFDFSNYKFDIIGIEDTLYMSFLSYKIEHSYYAFDNSDQKLGLNAVVTNPKIISDYKIIIEDSKYEYLLKEKLGSLEIMGIDSLSKEKLIELLQARINTNYIFNIKFSEDFDCLKCATLIEIYNETNRKKYLTVFEVKNDTKELRLISMY